MAKSNYKILVSKVKLLSEFFSKLNKEEIERIKKDRINVNLYGD